MTEIANNILFFRTSTYEIILSFICISDESCLYRNNEMTFYTLCNKHSSFSEAIGKEENETVLVNRETLRALIPHDLFSRMEMAPVNPTP